MSVILLFALAYGCTDSSTNKKNNEIKSTNNNNNNNNNNNGGDWNNCPYYNPYNPYCNNTGTETNTDPGNGGGSGYPPDGITPGDSYGTGYEPGVPDAGQTTNYFKINNPPVVVHGAGSQEIVWSSETDLPNNVDPAIFQTDSRFNLRVIPRTQSYGSDTRGRTCPNDALEYTKLNVGVKVRKSGTTVGEYIQFTNIAVDKPSWVHEFSVPATSDPLVIEVLNVEWDYSCIYYALDGYDPGSPELASACQFDQVWPFDCVAIEIQFSTDYTKDFPASIPRQPNN